MRSRLALLLVALVVGVTAVAGAGARSTATPPLTIYAAASLTDVFRAFDPAQNFSFAGSNALETQIRNGAPADIFASAAPLNTQRLFRAGLVDKPVTFTANRLALIVPKSNPAGIRTDLRPPQQAGEARGRRPGRAGRRVHDHRAAEDGALERAEQGRQP